VRSFNPRSRLMTVNGLFADSGGSAHLHDTPAFDTEMGFRGSLRISCLTTNSQMVMVSA